MATVFLFLCISRFSFAQVFDRRLSLPIRGKSQRVTHRMSFDPGSTLVLFDQEGPGCILHWWITHTPKREDPLDPPHTLQLRITYDGHSSPTIDMPLAHFFGVLLDKDVYDWKERVPNYNMNNAALKILPKNALNCYLPIPFNKLRIEIKNNSPTKKTIWFMADWVAYDKDFDLTPMRLNVIHRKETPAAELGSYLMADMTGSGFISGMILAIRQLDGRDSWYHCGGDLWLLDGETDPHAIRGIGGEDMFGMSYGIWPSSTEWTGLAYTNLGEKPKRAAGKGYEGIVYRIFGHDPVWFNSSAVVRFGSLKNELESVIYAYLDPKPAPAIITAKKWVLAGPFPCRENEYKAFEQREWPEDEIEKWPKQWSADFGVYKYKKKAAIFPVPLEAKSQHGWCDFAEHYRGKGRTNVGTQGNDASAYAIGNVNVPRQGSYLVRIGFDDWLTLWVNGQKVYTGRHDHGIRVKEIPIELPAGEVELRVKLSNQQNQQWRLWAFNLNILPTR